MKQSCRAGHESSKDVRDPCEGAREPLDVSRENDFSFVPRFKIHTVVYPLS